jgi:two-component system cell cycle response regulator
MASMVPDESPPRLVRGLNRPPTARVWTRGEVQADDARRGPEPELTGFPRRVLLVEPSLRECVRLRNELIAGQMEVYTASDLIAATHALANFQPNLILAQMRLPTYGGMELVRRVKEDCSTRFIPVILYSEITTAEERVKALELGAADLLSKPFIRAELIARVRAALRVWHTLSMLEQRAHLDSLTGLANRGVLEDQLLREWDACHRRGTLLTVVIVDLDHFKVINDMYGHAVGDEVLRQTARTLALSVRSSDLVARFGGEEFVVVAPDCPMAAAITLARRFRTALAEQTIFSHGTDMRVTASVGIATADWTMDSPTDLLRQADETLYQAKRSGRDAIWIYNSSQGRPTVAVASGAAAC